MACCFGVREYWSVGVLEKARARISTWISPYHHSITPPLHYSNRLTHQGKTLKTPSGGSSKPGPSGLDSLLLTQLSYFSSVFPNFMDFCLEEQGISVNIQGQEPWSVLLVSHEALRHWNIAEYQITSTKSKGCRCQGVKLKWLHPEHWNLNLRDLLFGVFNHSSTPLIKKTVALTYTGWKQLWR